MKVALKRTAIATSTVACVVLLSFSWSEQRGGLARLGTPPAGGMCRAGQPYKEFCFRALKRN
jgi:hypothetical protein